MKYRFIFDERKCVSCSACSVACMDQNDLYPENGDKPFRKCFVTEEGHGDDVHMKYISEGCMHCDNAPCVDACPCGCLRKDEETGFTLYDPEACIGCRSCLKVCPYDAPVFNDGKMSKCDGCVDRVKNGLEPACVSVCPFDALMLVESDN